MNDWFSGVYDEEMGGIELREKTCDVGFDKYN
jgi:hypothetical protein